MHPSTRLSRGFVLATSLAALAPAAMALHAAPAEPVLAAEPQVVARRIVTLQPSLTEIVCALEACDRLVAVDRHSDWPRSVDGLPRVGGLADANLELILAARPDLVILGPHQRVAERLKSLGVRVLMLDGKTHADMRRNMEAVASVLGRPGAGLALSDRINARLDKLRASVPARWKGRRVYFELHSGLAAASEASFIGETLALMGLTNVVPASLGPFPSLGPEFAVRADPDLLILHGAQAKPLEERPGWKTMRAVREQRVCRIPPAGFDVMIRPGPRVDEAAEQLLACLQAVDARQAAAR